MKGGGYLPPFMKNEVMGIKKISRFFNRKRRGKNKEQRKLFAFDKSF